MKEDIERALRPFVFVLFVILLGFIIAPAIQFLWNNSIVNVVSSAGQMDYTSAVCLFIFICIFKKPIASRDDFFPE